METCTVLCGTTSCVLGWLNDHATAVVALLSFIVSLVAIRFTARQIHIAQEHNKLSVRPHLVLWAEWKESARRNPAVLLTVRNFGLGPALLTDPPVFRVDGREVDINDPAAAADAMVVLFGDKWAHGQSYFQLVGEYAIQKDGSLPLVEIEADPSMRSSMRDILQAKVKITMPYRSPYEERLLCESRPVVTPPASQANVRAS